MQLFFFSLILIPVNKKAVLWKGIGLLSYKKTLQSEIKINGPFVHAPANWLCLLWILPRYVNITECQLANKFYTQYI